MFKFHIFKIQDQEGNFVFPWLTNQNQLKIKKMKLTYNFLLTKTHVLDIFKADIPCIVY